MFTLLHGMQANFIFFIELSVGETYRRLGGSELFQSFQLGFKHFQATLLSQKYNHA